MQLLSSLLSVLWLFSLVVLPANACAWYEDCKCHDDETGVQNNTVTELACKIYEYGKGYYKGDDDHHQCTIASPDGGIANCGWNRACQRYGNYHQVCWNKFGHASKDDGRVAPPGWVYGG